MSNGACGSSTIAPKERLFLHTMPMLSCIIGIAVKIAVNVRFCSCVVHLRCDLVGVGGVVAVGVRFERGLYHTAYRLLSGLFRLAWYRLFRLILSTGHENMRGFQKNH